MQSEHQHHIANTVFQLVVLFALCLSLFACKAPEQGGSEQPLVINQPIVLEKPLISECDEPFIDELIAAIMAQDSTFKSDDYCMSVNQPFEDSNELHVVCERCLDGAVLTSEAFFATIKDDKVVSLTMSHTQEYATALDESSYNEDVIVNAAKEHHQKQQLVLDQLRSNPTYEVREQYYYDVDEGSLVYTRSVFTTDSSADAAIVDYSVEEEIL